MNKLRNTSDMENYEEKYKQAIEAAKRELHYCGSLDCDAARQIFRLFPELKENKDERIKKAILKMISDIDGGYPFKKYGIIKKDAIAWLEKQGEQKPYMIQWKGNNLKEIVEFTGKSPKFGEWFKTWEEYENYVHTHNNIFKIFNEDGSHVEVPVGAWIIKTPDGYNVASRYIFKQKPNDKVEPKFKVGDWCIDNEDGTIFQIVKVLDNTYTYKTNKGEEYYCAHYSLEIDARLWTIQDAKDGDVLADNLPFIFKRIDHLQRSYAYCGISIYGFQIESEGELGEWTWMNDIKPATKEQCDILFQKMKEAGYEWDAKKKELKKIEQNSAWSEEDEKKTSLSDYDLSMIDNLVTDENCPLDSEYISWLQSLKDRVQPQPKQEWSKEDEEMYKEVLTDIIYAKNDLKTKGCLGLSKKAMKAFNWFSKRHKSLKPQPHWKPSEEQMEALLYALGKGGTYNHEALTQLYNNLKTL